MPLVFVTLCRDGSSKASICKYKLEVWLTLFSNGSGCSSSSNVALSVGDGKGVAANLANPSSWCLLFLRLAVGGDGGGLGGRNCFWRCSCEAAMVSHGLEAQESATTMGETSQSNGAQCKALHLAVM